MAPGRTGSSCGLGSLWARESNREYHLYAVPSLA